MEAMQLSTEFGPETAFVVLSGNQWFVPLVQRLFGKGHFVLMSTLESPSHADDLPSNCQDLYLNAEFLLGGPGRKMDLVRSEVEEEESPAESQRPTVTTPLDDPAARRTLESIDSYFGQYEEIYLTPLLRKLSEVMDDPDDEPKLLINDLEQAGAVWLEKRRGFPHNYTVLLMNLEHPDVAEIKEANASGSFAEESEDEYDDDDYDSDEYDEYDDDSEEGLDDDPEDFDDDSDELEDTDADDSDYRAS